MNQWISYTTIQALGSLGEFVSAMVVVVSLIYLGRQMKQNTASVRAASFNSMVQNSISLLEKTYSNGEVAEFISRAERDPSTLTPGERRRWDAYMTAVYRHFGNVVYQYRSGALDHRMWESYDRTLRDHLRNPSWAQWFHANRHVFSDALQEHVEKIMDELAEGRRAR